MNGQFNEAPASVTVRTISPAGFDVMLTIRDNDTGQLMPRMLNALGWLERQGFTPTTKGHASNGATAGGNGAAPVCQYHGPMKRSKKFAGWYCSARMGDGSYCKEKVLD